MATPPSLVEMDFSDGFKVARIFRGLPTKTGNPANSSDDFDLFDREMRLKLAINDEPDDWFLKYALGDVLLQEKKYLLAIHELEIAYKLRPFDIRSTFALATAYRTLTRAQYLNIPLEWGISDENPLPKDYFPKGGSWQSIKDEFDPETSSQELLKSGLTIDEVAKKAMFFFEETLHLGVRQTEIKPVIESLQRMYSDFPHLEIAVKNQIIEKWSGKPTPGIEDNILNSVIGHYIRLRFLLNTPPRYRFELGEVIRLCLWGITSEKENGDLYVLLANGYSLLDTCFYSTMRDHELYKKWASAILHYWSENLPKFITTPENIKIGEKLLGSLIAEMMKTHNADREVVLPLIQSYAEDYLAEALSPSSYTKIKEMLESIVD